LLSQIILTQTFDAISLKILSFTRKKTKTETCLLEQMSFNYDLTIDKRFSLYTRAKSDYKQTIQMLVVLELHPTPPKKNTDEKQSLLVQKTTALFFLRSTHLLFSTISIGEERKEENVKQQKALGDLCLQYFQCFSVIGKYLEVTSQANWRKR
jgi:hypothetical protein